MQRRVEILSQFCHSRPMSVACIQHWLIISWAQNSCQDSPSFYLHDCLLHIQDISAQAFARNMLFNTPRTHPPAPDPSPAHSTPAAAAA